MTVGSSSSSEERPEIDSLNSRMPLPTALPASGRRLGPRITSASTSTIASSIGPTLKGMAASFSFEVCTGACVARGWVDH